MLVWICDNNATGAKETAFLGYLHNTTTEVKRKNAKKKPDSNLLGGGKKQVLLNRMSKGMG